MFWRDVWLYLMMVKYVPGNVEIIEDRTPPPDLSRYSQQPQAENEKEKPSNRPGGYTIN
jgi:hypothetical protein